MDTAAAIARLAVEGILPPGPVPEVSVMAGGYWNLVLRLRVEAQDWVVKVFDSRPERRLFPILPDSEARAMESLAGLAIAPEPVGYLPCRNDQPAILVYRFHAGQPWQEGTDKVAALLRRQHALRPEGFRLLATAPADLLAQGDWLIRHLEDEFYAARLQAARPRSQTVPLERLALVHTDAGPGNLIEGPAGLRLIDWQCPGIGDPAEDLYSFLAPCFQILFQHEPLTERERVAFFAASGDGDVAARLHAMWPYYSYRMLAYCCLRRYRLSGRDETTSARYRRAIEAELPMLEG